MKKKAIEKIPYLGLKKVSRKKQVKYIGVTALKNVAHERHFFLEVYENKKTSMDVPVVRIVCTQKDFGTYFPEKNEWSRQKKCTMCYSDGLIWESQENRARTYQKQEEVNVLYDAADLERIEKFFKDIKVYNKGRWWEFIERKQDSIVCDLRRKTEQRKYARRQQALKERCENTADLPKHMLLEMADERFFNHKHYLFYKKRGSYADIACSKCGGVTEARWRSGISYESQFQKHVQEPREGGFGYCPMCGARGEWKCQGKVRSAFSKTVHVFLGQKYKETGFVMRYIELSKEWQLQMIYGEKGPEMYNSCEELSGIEIARAYFEDGKAVQTDFQKHDPYAGRDFWDDCNLYGLSNIVIKEGPLLEQTYEEMKGTIVQYSGLKEYMAAVKNANPINYLKRYKETPQLEMLMKLGLHEIAKSLVDCRYGIVANQHAQRPDEFLGIRKDRVKFIISKGGNLDVLRILQSEKWLGENWTEEQIEKLAEIQVDRQKLHMAVQIMTIQKMLNRIEKYAGCEFGTGCTTASARLKHTADIYFDYLSMRQTLGYNLENTVYQQTRNLEQAHNNMIVESNKIEADKRLQEVAERYPNIKRKYRAWRKKYYYEDDNYVIRPARSAEEIVMEGRLLHHCVGGNNYLQKHNTGASIILMLRFKDKESEPYITVEIADEKILQWYGAHDRKPDKDNMQRWLDAYVTRLKCNRFGIGQKTENEIMQQMLAYA